MNSETVVQKFADFLINVKQMSEGTVRGYKSDISIFLKSFPNFQTLTRAELIEYLSSMKNNYSAPAIHRKTAAIQSFYNFLVEVEVIKQSIAVDLPRPRIRKKLVECPEKQAITEWQKIAEAKEDDTLSLAIQLGANVGLRITETVALRCEDIDFNNGKAILRDTKTAETAEVAINKQTLKAIADYCNKRGITNGPVLRNKSGQPFAVRTFQLMIQQKLPVNYHQLRKACATALANDPRAGIHVAQSQLRHSSINTTLLYVRKDLEHQRNVLDQIMGG